MAAAATLGWNPAAKQLLTPVTKGDDLCLRTAEIDAKPHQRVANCG
jgi:hypothetical protein